MNETFGQRFARLRKNKGLTQEDIASKINITAQAVSKWENDISSPDISILPELSTLLGVSLDELLGKETPKPVEIVPEEQRKDVNKLTLKIIVNSSDGDKINVNLPLAIVKICLETGMKMPKINGSATLENIDLNQILLLAEQGVIGELVSVDSADGDHIIIVVE
ncbi:MAG: helix-turn-helix domain-containing protein [Candidatus Coproplasma sp.]